MVQKQVQKSVQIAKKGRDAAMDENTMPQFMFKSPRGTGYLFRRGVPTDVRAIIGKREFKLTLGGNYQTACERCRELAVETDKQIAAARASSNAQLAPSGELAHEIAQSALPLIEISEISPDFVRRLHATVIEQVQRGDREQRYRGREAINVTEKLGEIERVRNWAVMARNGDDMAVKGWSDMLSGTLKRSGYRLADQLRGSQEERVLLIEFASASRWPGYAGS
ncbi:hypothetical protein KVP09_11020 [Alcaligenaceae bacterium CGII-47]|nr:hypothetical protein [Alcaligenaceae bacterium CGII-47]